MIDSTMNIDRENLIEVSKPIFYGFSFLSAVSLMVSPALSGTLLGIAVMAAISLVSAGLSDSLDEDWRRFTEIIAVVTLLGAVLAASYAATLLAFQ